MNKIRPAEAVETLSHPSPISQHFLKLLLSETSRQTSLLFGAQLASTILNAATLAVVARWLGTDRLGIFNFCSISIIQFFSYFFEFGVASAGARLLAIERGGEGERRMLGAMLSLAVLIGLGFSLFILFTAELIDPIFNTNVETI